VTDFPTFRAIEASEFAAFYRSLSATFGNDPRDSEREAEQKIFELDRSVAGFDGTDIVATSGIYSRTLTVPGGEQPFAAVTMVTVAPTHRRRGALTEMMRRMFTDVHERGREAVAGLWASEATIYGRFGYGMAARNAAIAVPKERLAVRPGIGAPGHIRLLAAEEARPLMSQVYEAAKVDQVGWLDRSEPWWDWMLLDAEDMRNGATTLRFAVHEGADGQPDGYTYYRMRDQDGAREANLSDLTATNPEAYAALWRFVLDMDLIGRVSKWHVPVDDPVQHLVTDRRALKMQLVDGLWVRLVEVDRALAGRSYSTELDVVLDVTDDFCPWNAGRYRLSGGPKGAECSRTKDSADLALDVVDLGAAYLGGIRLTELAAAGRITELRPGALTAASRAFVGDRDPWCPDGF